jgi:hypothetical protein
VGGLLDVMTFSLAEMMGFVMVVVRRIVVLKMVSVI